MWKSYLKKNVLLMFVGRVLLVSVQRKGGCVYSKKKERDWDYDRRRFTVGEVNGRYQTWRAANKGFYSFYV